MTLDAGWTLVVRRWFLMYGPETADFQRQDYDTVTWIWAAAVTIMTNVHRRHWAQPNGDEPTDTAMVAGFQGVVRQATIAEMYAAEEWRPPAAVGGMGAALERDSAVLWAKGSNVPQTRI